jgi:Spy/CpxP family protein refolding chaperone
VAVILCFAAGAAVAAAPDSSQAKGNGAGDRIAKELGLSADQKAKLKDLREEMKGVRKEHMEKMKALLDKSKEELLKASPNKGVLYGYAKQSGDLRRIMAQKEADHLLKVKAILTPEQFKQLLSKDFRHGAGRGPTGPRDKGPHGNGPRQEMDEE